MLLLLAFGVLLVVVPAAAVYYQALNQARDAAREQADLSAGLVASPFRQWVAQQAGTAELIVRDSQLARLMIDAGVQQRQARAAALAKLFPDAIRVRLLPPGIDKEDPDADPPIGYAALEMLQYAETQETPPPVEVDLAGTPQQHINLVRRILDPSGRRIVGLLMVSFSLRPLQTLLDQADVAGYAELQQVSGGAPLVLASHGAAAFKSGPAVSSVAIPGTRWRVVYWPPAGAAGSGLLLVGAAASGVAALLLALLVWLVLRRTGTALRADLATLLTLVKDMRDGRLRQGYPARLAELRDTLELMTRAAGAMARRPAPAASVAATPTEATAAEPVPEEVVDEVGGDLLFDEDALDISRVDVTEEKVGREIFRAYDIRGIVGQTLTTDVAYEIGRAIGSEAYFRGEQTVVVGRDGRLSSPELSEALIRGLKATGRDVKDIGQVPTPVLYFAAQYLDASSGVMVTGSHNPPDYNGFKIVLGGETLANEAIEGLRERIESGDLLTGEGTVETVDVLPDYIERIKSDVQLVRPLKVVVDCGNGVASVAAPRLLRELGCEVVELFCEVDGNFPNHHPDPSRTENLAALIQAVQENGADLGIAFDGDGDRIGVVSSEGEIIWPDRVLMLLAMDVLSRNPGAQIIYDVKSSRNVASVVAEYGGEALMWATGHSLIKAKMKETGALLAGEMSGHIFFRERWFGFDDALYAAARLLEILANDHRSSSDIFAALPDSVNTPELSVPMAEGEPCAFMEKLLNSAHFDNARIATVDGMRVEFDKGWGLVRASNTTPSLVLRFEADDELALHSIQEEFRRVMLQVDASLSLPF
ncbi:MAG TPA: phosphomannomutase/phosphoglucomutase [Gammaproteobacteria bacterium]|nr:phosphomannomutase/phosphoglucomutase [Gammaproteobacteria bacterium]